MVEHEEPIYTFVPPDNGAGPLWDLGSTNLVRLGDRVFASGVETLPGVPPYNNSLCHLWQRDARGWSLAHPNVSGRTREPCPLVALPSQNQILLSANPTLNRDDQPGGGPAEPMLWSFSASDTQRQPAPLKPRWKGGAHTPDFDQHSYRSFASDAASSEVILFHNVGDTRAEWTFRGSDGTWPSQGQLVWPWGASYEHPKPIRICYPNVALTHRKVHFVGVSDVLEPQEQWRTFKRGLTGKEWDYDFRRLFYTWSDDILDGQFHPWIELASRESTAGRIMPGDLWPAPDGTVHIVWQEEALDPRLRSTFFPLAVQRVELNYLVLRDGRVLLRTTLVAWDETQPGPIPRLPRFHVTPDHRLFVFFYVTTADAETPHLSENRLLEILPNGSVSPATAVRLAHPLSTYMTATSRAGTMPSWTLDLLGTSPESPNVVRYAKIGIR